MRDLEFISRSINVFLSQRASAINKQVHCIFQLELQNFCFKASSQFYILMLHFPLNIILVLKT